MKNETISRLVGCFLGAALIIAGLAAFTPRTTSAPQAALHDTGRYQHGNSD